MDEIRVQPIWSDSMGAKSFCIKVETDDTSFIIDPGAAVMQKSYPIDVDRKYKLLSEARQSIDKAARDVDNIIVTHYHYDHHFLPTTGGMDFTHVFDNKELWIKDPNRWINRSQWNRSRKFLKALVGYRSEITDKKFSDFQFKPEQEDYGDMLDGLPLARDLDAGDYKDRREELHEKWRKKYFKRVDMWNEKEHVNEISEDVHFADGREQKFGKTKIKFTEPLFHGIEYANTGWVIGMIIERQDEKFFYSSDLHGPTIEDYAEMIIEEDPDFIVLDGPATYHLGHLLNNFNLNRSVKNASRVIEETDFETMLYDHHLTRGKFFRKRTEGIWNTADKVSGEVISFREYVEGKQPLIEEVTQ